MIHFINENAFLYWYSAFCKVLRFFVPKEVMKRGEFVEKQTNSFYLKFLSFGNQLLDLRQTIIDFLSSFPLHCWFSKILFK